MEQKELERAIITSVLKDTNLIDDLVEKTTIEHFKDNISRQAYQWLYKRYQQNKKVSMARISRTDIKVEKLFGHSHTLKEFGELLDLLHKDYSKRKLQEGAREINKLTDNEELTYEEMQHKAQEIIFQKTSDIDTEEGIHTLEEALEKAYNGLVEQGKDKEVKGLSTGYPSIDSRIGGLQNGHLTVIAGQTSMGKTAFTLNIILNAIKNDKNCMFVSLEMTEQEIADRLLIMDSRVNATDYNTILEDWQIKNVTEAMNRMFDKKMTISDKRGLSVEDIKAKCRKKHRQENLDLIVVDYLQMIRLPTGQENTARKVGEVVLQLRNLAGELGIPIILLSQLNRGVDGRPKLRHLRDSGNIEEFADEVWFLYREMYEEAEQPARQESELLMKKGRTSGTGYVELVWYPNYQIFRDGYIEETKGAL